MAFGKPFRRALVLAVGGVLLLVGAALLVLPGPGLLLILAGLVVLASEFPGLARYVEMVEARAMRAAEDSVSSPWRLAGSALVALALIAGGIMWGLLPDLPFSNWSTGSGLIASGVILAGLLYWSHRRMR
ncbi:PGPGW domain-containing protein [Streptomyces radicis]|uniref:Transmembrane protein PGPGW n=1 Tax=Streptomyces radicis TaxID=1750517 RepID=A0A3A9VTS7_9ACTN|nr:PGPGW domain-containing protein [Streptomyces radicis]RKN04395.1 hypothetical protein D7319_28340 [Streptomyces radicis]RKN15163.1 hypothetical protein D7318_27745 [Streptomyces radicis]